MVAEYRFCGAGRSSTGTVRGMDDRLREIETALADVDADQHVAVAAPALVAVVRPSLELGDDEVEAAARRGLLLAAAAGDPARQIGAGSPAVAETASELVDIGAADVLHRLLSELAGVASAAGLIRCAAVARALRDRPAAAMQALAQVVLYEAVSGE